MLEKHLTLPHKVICFTDDPTDIICETQPIPASQLLKYGRCWHRLWLFSTEAAQLGTRLVSMDLDTVIVDNINTIVNRTEPFVIWRGSYPNIAYCGSIWALDAGAFPWVWEQFDPTLLIRDMPRGGSYTHPACRAAGHTIGSDQTWMALKLPQAATWTFADGVLSYRLEARGSLPPGARIVNFHGLEDPSLVSCQRESPWIVEHWR